MIFFLKKAFSPMFMPLTVSILLLGFGVLMLWFSRRQLAGRLFVTLGAIVLTAFSFAPLPDLLTLELEKGYPPAEQQAGSLNVRYVAVLGGGIFDDPRLPPLSRLRPVSAMRLMEGLRRYHSIPECRLILSGGPWRGEAGCAEIMAQVAKELGVPEGDIIVRATPRDTREEAESIRDITGDEPFLLVTSAVHMSRAMFLFERFGMRPIPAPVEYGRRNTETSSPEELYPTGENLVKAERAIHEYLGILWAWLTG